MLFGLLSLSIPGLGGLSLLLIAALWLRYAAVLDSFMVYKKRENAKGVPLVFPYVFPFLGSLPITYLWRPRDFVLSQK